jgi:D-aminoacyl-tRNA deacylase
MRAVVQRVLSASVSVRNQQGDFESVSEIGAGLLILVGVRGDDTAADAEYLASKAAGLRIFEDADGKLNLSVQEVGGQVLAVSNFTLYGDARKGKRPSFTEAAPGSIAEAHYRHFGSLLEGLGVSVAYGQFGAEMRVSLINDGPVTLLIDSRKQF